MVLNKTGLKKGEVCVFTSSARFPLSFSRNFIHSDNHPLSHALKEVALVLSYKDKQDFCGQEQSQRALQAEGKE